MTEKVYDSHHGLIFDFNSAFAQKAERDLQVNNYSTYRKTT